MKKVLLVLLCCMLLSLLPPGSSAKNANPGQGKGQISSGDPQTEDQAKKSLEDAKALMKEGKYQEAKELLEKVKKSNLAAEAEKLLDEIKVIWDKAQKSLEDAKGFLKDGKYQDAKKLAEDVKKLTFKDLTAEAEKLLSEIDAALVESEANANLAIASYYQEVGNYPKALEVLENFIKKPPKDPNMLIKAGDGLIEALEKKADFDNRNNRVTIDIAKRITEQGDLEGASKKLEGLMPLISNDKVFAEAKEALEKTKPNFRNKVWMSLKEIWEILKNFVYWLLILLCLVVALRLIKWVYQFLFTSRVLQIRETGDDNNYKVIDLFLASLHQWGVRQARASEGLLRLEVPRSAALLGQLPGDKLLSALNTLPTVGQVDLKGLSVILQKVWDWLILCPPWMKATFKKDTNQIIAEVILQRRKDQVALLYRWSMQAKSGEKEKEDEKPSAPKDKDAAGVAQGGLPPEKTSPQATHDPSQENKAKQASSQTSKEKQDNKEEEQIILEEVDCLAFKVLYLLSEEEATVKQAEGFDELRHGVAQLNQHLTALPDEEGGDLEKIRETFEKVQHRYPRLLPAFLYEGFILDLLGEHEEAARRFEFVKMKATEEGDEDLSLRAAYNEAIAHLHNYTCEEVQRAKSLLELLTGPIDQGKQFRKSSLKALAYAAQACVVAHLPLFWKEVEPKLPESLNERMMLEYKRERLDMMKNWQQDVENMTEFLQEFEKKVSEYITDAAAKTTLRTGIHDRIWPESSFPDWNRSDCRGLQLSIHDARAHLYLNCAIEFLDGPTPDFEEGFNQKAFLDKAREEFRQCELLQTPSAENQADIGTLYLFLGDYEGNYEKASTYLKNAIKLKNGKYEYAYLRLAQTYEREKNIDEVVKTLNEFTGTPRLKEFMAMYEKYKNYPPLAPEQREKFALWYPLGSS